MLAAMTNPELRNSSSVVSPLGRFAHLAVPGARLRAALASWTTPLALAFLVGLVLLATSSPQVRFSGDFPSGVLGATGVGLVAHGLANVAAIVAVVLSRHQRGLACALATVPWLLSPVAATMVWGWWLAGLAVLGIAVFDRTSSRRHGLPSTVPGWIAAR